MDTSLTDLVLNPKSKKIARPPNAFMIFAREHRKSFASQNPSQNNKLISKMLGDAWKKIDPAARTMYFDKAKKLEMLHKQKYPGYSYSPRIARLQKMKRSMRKGHFKRCPEDMIERVDIVQNHMFNDIQDHVHNDVRGGYSPDNCSTGFLKKSSSPEYIPNNPNFFGNPNPMLNVDEPPSLGSSQPQHQPHSSQSSTSSLCLGYDGRPGPYPDYYCRAPSSCTCTSCEKYWQERPLYPPHDPFWNSCSRDDYRSDYQHSRTSEPDSIPAPVPPSYPCCQRQSITHHSCCSPSYARNPYAMCDPRSIVQSYYEPMPWQQPYTWRPTIEEDPYYLQNYYRGRNFELKCCGANFQPHYTSSDYSNYSSDSNCKDEKRMITPEAPNISDAIKTSMDPDLSPRYESEVPKIEPHSNESAPEESYSSEVPMTSNDSNFGENGLNENVMTHGTE